MKDLMIDIETLNTATTSAILSIGAVYFDRRTGQTGEQFYARICFADAVMHGTVSDDTLLWWSKQSEESRNEAFGGTESIHDVMEKFADFIRPDAEVWGNGSVFDITILEHWFNSCGMSIPWKFWNIRDVRTIVSWFNIDTRSYVREGVHHNALDDCLHQIKYMCGGVNNGNL